MSSRRQLLEGINKLPDVDPAKALAFIAGEQPASPAMQTPERQPRSPLTTRLRKDMADALKRASLERQLKGETPSAVQDILEAALEPWLKSHGYLN